MPVTRERPWMCHACGHGMDAATLAYDNDLSGVAPDDGDYSICIRCGEPHIRYGGAWRKVTPAELADMHAPRQPAPGHHSASSVRNSNTRSARRRRPGLGLLREFTGAVCRWFTLGVKR